MSIFKDSFKQGIQDQIRARQKAIFDRTPQSVQYYNSRNAWIRMTSAVNVNGSDELAKKHILQGGVLLNGKLRSGVGKTGNEAYSTLTPGGVSNRLGIRPMPGIIGIEVKSKSAYGSLREVTVNFNAWDIHQLEDLELLYMRPGYSVLIEWGWTPYLDNNGVLQNNINFYPDFFKGGKTKEDIWKEIYDKSAKDGNYEAMYGFVKNYGWSARSDGGYDCNTTIISIGEVLESLKINYGAFDTSLSNKQGIFGTNLNPPAPTQQMITGGTLAGSTAVTVSSTTPNPIANYYSQNIVAGICAELRDKLLFGAQTDGSHTIEDPKDKSIKYNFLRFPLSINNKNSGNTNSSDNQFYITLDSFLQILNKYVLLKDTNAQGNGKPIVTLSTKDREGNDLLCLGNIFQIATNPTVCFIINKAWKDPQETLGISGAKEGSFSSIQNLMKLKDTQNYFYNNDFKDKQLGVIGNIYVNLDYLIDLATNNNLASQDKKEKNDIAIFDYLKSMMSGINTSIGNLANFDIHVDPTDSVARIIDVNYVDTKSRQRAYEEAFMFEIQKVGSITSPTGSIVRNYKLESQIFPEQSTIVAIGAQVQGGALGSNSNTLIDFNKNLTDRIIPKKESPSAINNTNLGEEILSKAKSLIENIKIIIQFITDITPDWYESAGDYDVQEASKYANALKDIINFYLSYTNADIKNRGIIPTKLSLETDGIGGLVIGNLFRIPNEVLPKGYKGNDNTNNTGSIGARIGYTVTGLGHSIQNNDWVTRIDSQFIILDDPKGVLTTEQFLTLAKEVNSAASTGNVAAVQQSLQTRVAPSTTPTGDLNYPITGLYRLTSPSLTPRTNPVTGEFQAIHGGSDLAVPINTPVYAVDDGIVEYAGQQNLVNINDGAGIYTKIKHTGAFNGKTTLSMHLNSVVVAKGSKVTKGQLIGYSGNTGSSTGPHLHFEIRDSATQTKLKVSDYFPGF